jgi:DNA-binding LacI/PurR family transcriptional regulator
LASEAVHGVVLAFGTERWILAREIAQRGTPCVVVTQAHVAEIPGAGEVGVFQAPVEEIPGVEWVYLDLESGARGVARMLIEHGHRRIGFIGNFEDDVVRVSFAQELMTAGVPLPPDLEIIAGAGRDAGASGLRRLLSLREPPTAVFARTDVLASGALQAARHLGIRVPEDLSLVGHDDIPLARRAGLTTVRIDCTQLGQAAARVLSSLLREGSACATPEIVRTQVIERDSVRHLER